MSVNSGTLLDGSFEWFLLSVFNYFLLASFWMLPLSQILELWWDNTGQLTGSSSDDVLLWFFSIGISLLIPGTRDMINVEISKAMHFNIMENTDLYLIPFGILVTVANEAKLNSISIARFQEPLWGPRIQNTASIPALLAWLLSEWVMWVCVTS